MSAIFSYILMSGMLKRLGRPDVDPAGGASDNVFTDNFLDNF